MGFSACIFDYRHSNPLGAISLSLPEALWIRQPFEKNYQQKFINS